MSTWNWEKVVVNHSERVLPWERDQIPTQKGTLEEQLKAHQVMRGLLDRGRWWYISMSPIRWLGWSIAIIVDGCVHNVGILVGMMIGIFGVFSFWVWVQLYSVGEMVAVTPNQIQTLQVERIDNVESSDTNMSQKIPVKQRLSGTLYETSFQSSKSRKMRVACGSNRSRGHRIVRLNNVAGQQCLIQVQALDGRRLRTTISEAQVGLYICFEESSLDCVLDETAQSECCE